MEEKAWDSAAAATGSDLDLAAIVIATAVTLRLQPAFGWWLRGGRRRENQITMTEKLTAEFRERAPAGLDFSGSGSGYTSRPVSFMEKRKSL
nr:cytochrome P450 90C1 [Ipomoea batatas]